MTDGHDPRTGARKYANLVAIWHNAFSHAQYVWLTRQAGRRIPWTPALKTYFHHRFARILINPAGVLYQRASACCGAWTVATASPASSPTFPPTRSALPAAERRLPSGNGALGRGQDS